MKPDHNFSALRRLPRVDDLALALPQEFSHAERVAAARQALDELRADWLRHEPALNGDASGQVLEEALERGRKYLWSAAAFPARVLNATGIIVHTGLGRSRLSQAAISAVTQAARDGCALEVSIESGERGQRDAALSSLLREITGCEDATVVNNGAGATVLCLAALCSGGEVACSRGELVEIGGGFRMPDVMVQSGCTLREVGTTNKTRLSDYRQVLEGNPSARGILKVHPSNFRIQGFTLEAPIGELAALARQMDLPLVDDLGSGALLDLSPWGLEEEPTVQEHVASGADAVIFSGDKLLGGPQCGIVCGRREAIARIRRHPLARALRADKMTLAALHATLLAYRDPRERFARARGEIPTLKALCEDEAVVKKRAQRLHRLLMRHANSTSQVLESQPESGMDIPLPGRHGTGKRYAAGKWKLEVRPSQAQAGAGSLPGRSLPSWSVVLCSADGTSAGVSELARDLRMAGVWGRVQSGALWLDTRTLSDEDVAEASSLAGPVLPELITTSNLRALSPALNPKS